MPQPETDRPAAGRPSLTTEQVWRALARQPFMVVAMVNRHGQGRSVGVTPAVHGDDLWFAATETDWKVTHLRHQPEVSVTVPVRRGGVLTLVAPIPPATVTVPATAQVLPVGDAPDDVRRRLLRGLTEPDAERGDVVMVRLTPHGDFVTYGLGVPLRVMADTERARGRVPVARG
jgi:Pyridoxamine 5'-phosphate oxidase